MAVLILSGAAISGRAGGKVAAWGDNYYGQTLLPNRLNHVKAVAAGYGHSLALKADGTVVGWGEDDSFQASPPSGLSGVVAIAAGGAHSLALRADGTVVGWGNTYYGQSAVPPGLSNVIAIADGTGHSLALKSDGNVAAWGWGAYGQTNVPAGLSSVVAIAASIYYSLALKADGTVAAWGYSPYGTTNIPPGLSNVIAIAAGHYQGVALKSDGTVATWGSGYGGQTNPPAGLSNVVAVAAGLSQSLALTDDGKVVGWGFSSTSVPSDLAHATAIAAGADHALAIVPDGPPEIIDEPADLGVLFQSNIVLSVTATGYQPLSYRWYFNGTPLADTSRISGVANVSLTISNAQFSDIGRYTVIVSNTLGSVQSTGAVLTVISPPIITMQPAGQTVIAGTNISLSVAAIGTPSLSYQWMLNGVPLNGATSTLLSLTNVQSSQSGNYSVIVSNAYGTLESSNALVTVLESPPYILSQPTSRSAILGCLATFTVNARGSTPMNYQWRFNGADIPGATGTALTLASLRYDQSGYYSVAISNAFGSIVSAKAQLTVEQVAVWATTPWYAPTNIPPGLTNLIAISANDSYILGLKADGTVAVWAGSVPRSLSPTNVPAGLNGVTGIAAGYAHCLALKSNGTVIAWGGGQSWGFPFPPVSPSASPTNVPAGLSNVIAVAAGDSHSLALKADGHVLSWGSYAKSYATNVPVSVSNIIAIAAGGGQSLALKADGRVVAWGGTTNVPGTLSNVIAIACAGGLNLAVQASGKVIAWEPVTIPIVFPPPRGQVAATNVPVGLSNVVAVTPGGGGSYAMALRSDGSVGVWGYNVPLPPPGLSNVFAISGGVGFLSALIGDGAPRFTIQPVGQTVTKGATVRFHARAVGVQPVSCRWQLDGVDLPGATNGDLTLTNAQGRDTGVYRVIAANALGSAASLPVALNIPFSTNLAIALNATNLVWTTTLTTAPWFAQIAETHDGDVAAQSGRITHSQQSVLQTAVVGPGTLTFWWKVSSEQGYDFLRFSAESPTGDFAPIVVAISGEHGWQKQTILLPAGTNQLRWAYAKDISVSAGQDAGWVDEVAFAPASPLMLDAPGVQLDGSFAFVSSDPSGRQFLPENLGYIEVQASTNLRDWTTLTNACSLINGALLIRDPECVRYPQRFYRVVER